jgi:hypothetical protein
MGSRRFLSWPAGWRKTMPWGILVGVVAGALLIVAQGLRSAWNDIDLCGTSIIIIFFLVVGVTAITARLRPAPNQDEKPPDADTNTLL